MALLDPYRGIAQSGSALALGARCREFKSLYPDQFGNSPPAFCSGGFALRRNHVPPIGATVSSLLELCRVLSSRLIWRLSTNSGDCSSAGRALDCDSGGRGFEPRQSPHFSGIYTGHRNDAFTSLPADLKPFSSSLENLQFKCIKLIKPALIELLLVVAIIGILVSFAIPAYQGSILKSRRSVAVSGLMDLVN